MLIICDACKSKIKGPDAAAGKKIKCPKCAAIIRVPPLETPAAPAPTEAPAKAKPKAKPTRIAQPESEPEPQAESEPEPEKQAEPKTEEGSAGHNELGKAMEADAAFAIKLARKAWKVNFDFSEASVAKVEEVCEQLFDFVDENERNVPMHSRYFGAYVGEVFRRHVGGEWARSEQFGGIPSIVCGDLTIFPHEKVRKRLTAGSEDNLVSYYAVFKLQASPDGPLQKSSSAPEEPATEPEKVEEPEPDEVVEEEADLQGTEVTSKPSKPGSKPPPIKGKKRGKAPIDDGDDEDSKPKRKHKRDDDDDDDDDDRKPKRKRSRDDDDDDDDDDDRGRKSRKGKRRRDDDDDDDDDLDIKKRSRHRRRQPDGPNGMAITSMILGIGGLIVYVLGGCCLSGVTGGIAGFVACPLSAIMAIVAIILGFMGNKPGSAGFAWTGIVCGFIVIGLMLVSVVLMLIFGMAIIGAGVAGPQPPRRGF